MSIMSTKLLRTATVRVATYRTAPSFALQRHSSISTSAAAIKQNCRKVVCIGRNYADHISELKNAAPKQPFFFLKPSSSILVPNAGPIWRPRGVRLHYEVELGLVMGRDVRDLDAEDEMGAMNAISDYVLAIDLTARNVQDEAKKKGLPWSIAKGFDTFSPISHPISKSQILDPYQAQLWLSVNGEMKQNDKAELMLFRIPRIISDISKVMALEKGDLILTGTPKGVGPTESGDVVRAGIQVKGKDIEESLLELDVVDRPGPYEYRET